MATSRLTDQARFLKHVSAGAPTICWPYLSVAKSLRYKRVYWGTAGKQYVYAHRRAYELFNGPIPLGMDVLHTCDNPPCVNPDHLFLGDALANGQDMARKGRAGSQMHPERRPRGERHHAAKLTEQDIRAIRACINAGQAYRSIAVDFGVSAGLIGHIAVGMIWKHVA